MSEKGSGRPEEELDVLKTNYSGSVGEPLEEPVRREKSGRPGLLGGAGRARAPGPLGLTARYQLPR